MKVLMFGWEFPPVVSGGLGVACHGIVQGLLDQQIEVTLVLPFLAPDRNTPLSLREKRLQYRHALNHDEETGDIHIELIDALLQPYWAPEHYWHYKKNSTPSLYGEDLWAEVQRYAHEAAAIARTASHDVIHAHDWL